MENVIGDEFKTHKTYSLTPIYETGVFHPKIMLLTGVKHGLLIIGSGNLTSSGLSTNDEVWAAFHLNSLESLNAPIFADVWHYFQPYLQQAKGFNKQKISWINQYAAWINELDNPTPTSFTKINNEQEVKFLANKLGGSIYKILKDYLPQQRIKRLTVISPYFDDKAKLLNQFRSDYSIDNILCISDSQFGLLPNKASTELLEEIMFYDWKDCLENFDKRFNRLHAKMFHFDYDNEEYLLLGSPNATIQAFGGPTSSAKNGEAALLLKRQKKGSNLLAELGISTLKATPLNISIYARLAANRGDSIAAAKWKYRIIYSERNGSKLTIHLQRSTSEVLELQVLDVHNTVIEKHTIEAGAREATVNLLLPDDAFRLCLFYDNKRVSNFALIHNVAYQAKCNPDPNQAELSQIIEGLSSDPDNDLYIELLKHADYNWVDDELADDTDISGGRLPKKGSSFQVPKQYGVLSEEQFNQLSSVQSLEIELMSNPNIQIADILKLVSKGLASQQNEIQENEEEALASEDLDLQSGHGKEVVESPKIRVRGGKEQRAINKHVTNLYSFFSQELSSLFEKKTLVDTPKRLIKLKVLSNMSIMLDLLYIFHGKAFTIYKTEFGVLSNKKFGDQIADIEKKYKLIRLKKADPTNFNIVYYEVDFALFSNLKSDLQALDKILLIQQEEYSPIPHKIPYILEGYSYTTHGSGLKADLIEVLGSFLICANTGYQHYGYEVYDDKVSSYRMDIFETATFLILNVSWKEDEEVYRDILLLDLLNFVCPMGLQSDEAKTVISSLHSFYERAAHKGTQFHQNLNYFKHEILSSYNLWRQRFEENRQQLIRETSTIRLGSLVYSSSLGFAALRQAGKDFIVLKKPGLLWDDVMGELLIKVFYPQTKLVTYEQQNIKTPLEQETIADTIR
ncbi:phospholipase D-like domain-containing protein [Pontibacter flavimaris]|uniref:PLD phosphodiesterase domain-containing protein n=1 Tax=Pontibacter flavimaris TaxID=1797110 RepID=A0A1Q5PCL9_9BACT|nr:hypothetical protein [Pontibacter flavimaris]OKL39986.1 hypothetical protein A3841_16625 [Pontibacter flavimaris]